MMKKKRGATLFAIVFVLFMGPIFYRNISTYTSIKRHTGYTYGIIIKVWDDDGWYSRYQYNVNGMSFKGRQGEKHTLGDTVIIVYDSTKPRFSMIAEYPSPILLNTSKELIELDTTLVKYRWWDYLPGDEIHSIKDLWSLD